MRPEFVIDLRDFDHQKFDEKTKFITNFGFSNGEIDELLDRLTLQYNEALLYLQRRQFSAVVATLCRMSSILFYTLEKKDTELNFLEGYSYYVQSLMPFIHDLLGLTQDNINTYFTSSQVADAFIIHETIRARRDELQGREGPPRLDENTIFGRYFICHPFFINLLPVNVTTQAQVYEKHDEYLRLHTYNLNSCEFDDIVSQHTMNEPADEKLINRLCLKLEQSCTRLRNNYRSCWFKCFNDDILLKLFMLGTLHHNISMAESLDSIQILFHAVYSSTVVDRHRNMFFRVIGYLGFFQLPATKTRKELIEAHEILESSEQAAAIEVGFIIN